MSGRDESVTSKEGLRTTKAGRSIMKSAFLKSRGYRMFNKYRDETKKQFSDFEARFAESLLYEIKTDPAPNDTQRAFADEIGTNNLMLPTTQMNGVRDRLLDLNTLRDRVGRILDSNFVKMTFPVFNALFDAANPNESVELKQNIVEGHILAIDLSEPMDRIVDRDEDLEYLDDYRLMNPYILKLARDKIAQGGETIMEVFEEGFKDARTGQYMDESLKTQPSSITEEQMNFSYKKYRAVMGTAGKNMALNNMSLGEIFYSGMAHASEAAGCGNEIEDSMRNGYVKVPSWPLYYTILSNDVSLGFSATMQKSRLYLEQARLTLDILPEGFSHIDFLKFLFMTVEHYNEYWYNRVSKADIWEKFQNNLPVNKS
ncbi:MAG: hypothetical protein F4Y82_05895 [Cenarchaeum sp. SB0665_bin_23]|nr:hypothetical protein [Cenarchaeum sp. SB0667_bin_13]MXY61623.1 hypothetical protein [Cenarchaeum sp. SB0665_bin_23]MXZ93810.1 hypothetical protein [Cenarchaeum sp. SB0666_bin_15]MYB47581.1 hypothetical protein [Cenarchaeum sp. SB0662_bin_33]MYC79342.1 hypothetical protein [Cenarchaeum sp. SB0661_bin_35]MYD59015.1 hypothetical protein [Cenarchaeum sp. SB0678_bin_8]MYG32919.1 hypothetical protein [Cenarchaeum sp. SB0677_bin_16]MYI51381.1 hypothetical protein [Cenarchaeum sp. SB0673_bin_9]M